MSDDDLHRTGQLFTSGSADSPEKLTETTAKLNVADIRKDYRKSGIRRVDLSPDPIIQFGKWMKEALDQGSCEPTSVALATSTPEGRPSVRTVLLKGFDARGFRFFTNYQSRKGRELAINPHAAMCFHWPELERQVRIEGAVEKASRAESEEYFSSRPAGSQFSAAASPQSQVVADREELVSRRRELEIANAGRNVPLPDQWGGYWLWPEVIEMWQGRADRLHDRLRYRRPPGSDDWTLDRLAP